MAFKILYFRAGERVSEVWSEHPLPDTRQATMKALARYSADYASILDLDNDGKLVETVKERA
jgi:hypothetical protein